MISGPIEIPNSKAKLIKLLVFSLIFCAAGLWMVIAQPGVSNPVFNSFIVKNTVGTLGVLMGVLGIIFFSRKLLDKRPGIIIDATGITDNTSALSLGYIPWADITAVSGKTVHVSVASKQKFITITLRDPEAYITGETNAIRRKAMSIGLRHSGTPVTISANGLKIKHEDLLQLLQEKFREYSR